tara:strand:- start:1535 stop:1822 length:288 start_codon:yes stop_codon:yes gene_type:complete
MEFYHGKKHDMWIKGCIPLGQFITESDHKFDLGIWEDPHNGTPSFSIVYGKEGSQYISGSLKFYVGELNKYATINDYFLETIKRYNKYLKNKGEE